MKVINIFKYYFRIFFLIISNIKIVSYTKNIFTVQIKNKSLFKVRNFMDIWMLAETYLNSDYEKNGTKIGDNWTIIDIGAAFGDFSIFAAQKSRKNKIYAVEPLPSSIKLFRQNIKNNHLKNIKIYPGALSSTQNKINIFEDKKNYGHSKTTTYSSLKTSAISLTKLFTLFDISHCDLIKCDCEGSEYDIFLNLSSQTYQKIDRIVMEYHLFSRDHKKKFNLLKTHFLQSGYVLKINPNPIHSNLGFLFAYRQN